MLLRGRIRKAKFFFHKTLQNLRSFFFFGGYYQKLPRSLSFKPFSRTSGNNNNVATYTKEDFYYEFYDQWQADLKRLNMIDEDEDDNNNNNIKEPDESTGSSVKKIIDEEEELENEENRTEEKGKKGVHVLAQKMKEMEMMDNVGDVEHLLDIEEALHYYSRLTSPVYLDIVNKFFMDMNK